MDEEDCSEKSLFLGSSFSSLMHQDSLFGSIRFFARLAKLRVFMLSFSWRLPIDCLGGHVAHAAAERQVVIYTHLLGETGRAASFNLLHFVNSL